MNTRFFCFRSVIHMLLRNDGLLYYDYEMFQMIVSYLSQVYLFIHVVIELEVDTGNTRVVVKNHTRQS